MASAILFFGALLQFTTPPQARTPEEYDAYLDVAEAAAPGDVLAAAQRFWRDHPRSELSSRVQEHCFEAYRTLGNRPRAIENGEASLAANPHNLALRANLAAVLANGAASDNEAAVAESHARRALDELSRFHPPRTVALADWRRIEGKVRSAAHSALGLIEFRRDRPAEAIREFEQALRFLPDAAVFYRLGKLYQMTGRNEEAATMFRRAVAANEPTVRALAEEELAK